MFRCFFISLSFWKRGGPCPHANEERIFVLPYLRQTNSELPAFPEKKRTVGGTKPYIAIALFGR